jgi:hypothetical protein
LIPGYPLNGNFLHKVGCSSTKPHHFDCLHFRGRLAIAVQVEPNEANKPTRLKFSERANSGFWCSVGKNFATQIRLPISWREGRTTADSKPRLLKENYKIWSLC